MAVHPRVRGDHRARFAPWNAKRRFIPACVGTTARHASVLARPSPVHPRVRGDHSGRLSWQPQGRFIPACVGTTARPHLAGEALTVHPRVRGDHVLSPKAAPITVGSSPRAWGPPRHIVRSGPRPPVHPRVRGDHGRASPPCRLRRFIPACVGTTRRLGPIWSAPTVHPRVRGDHNRGCCDPRLAQAGSSPRAWGPPQASVMPGGNLGGSSPRAWGPRQTRGRCLSVCRFIPACVGTTARAMSDARRRCDGSSPRAWGPRVVLLRVRGLNRFIPACVGTTRRWTPSQPCATVHPRVRGDHPGQRSGLANAGSSPRAWGPPGDPPAARPSTVRFIPACVGTTCAILDNAARRRPSVHPRVRGDHMSVRAVECLIYGSSPRAWGPLARHSTR